LHGIVIDQTNTMTGLHTEIDSLRAENEALRSEVAALRTQVEFVKDLSKRMERLEAAKAPR
jgi:cell division protein FtsB